MAVNFNCVGHHCTHNARMCSKTLVHSLFSHSHYPAANLPPITSDCYPIKKVVANKNTLTNNTLVTDFFLKKDYDWRDFIQ